MSQKMISLIGMAATFGVAYGLDRWVEVLRRKANTTFAYAPAIWLASLADLFVAGMLFLLAGFVRFKAPRSAWVSVVYLIVGLLVTFFLALEISVPSVSSLPLSILAFFAPSSRTVYVGAFVAVIGLAGLVSPPRPRAEQ